METNYTDEEKQLIKESWECQDACNLSGILIAFERNMGKLRKLVPMNQWNQHLMVKLYVSKLQSLCGDLPIVLPDFLF